MCGQGHLYLPPHSGFSDHQDGRAKFPNDVELDMVSDPEGLWSGPEFRQSPAQAEM